MEEQQYKSSFVRALAERWQFWRPMAVDKVGKMDRVPRLILKSALDTFDVFNRMPEFLEKLDGDDKVRTVIEAEIKALAATIEEPPPFAPTDDDTMGGTIEEEELPASEEVELEEVEPTEEVESPEALDAEPTLKDVFKYQTDIEVPGKVTKPIEEPAEEVEGAKELSETGKHIADIWKDHGSDSLVEYTAPEEPEPQYVQVLDPLDLRADRWQIIDRQTGKVTNRKKSPGPYKNVPFMEEVKDAGDGEADNQDNTADQAEDQQ